MFKYAQLDENGYVLCANSTPIECVDFAARGFVELAPEVEIRDAPFRLYDPQTKTLGEKRPLVIREITRGQFIDRFSVEAQLALEQIAEGQDLAGRTVRVFTRRLEAETTVNLDSPVLAATLPQVAAILQGAGVKGWATQQEAAARVAEILA